MRNMVPVSCFCLQYLVVLARARGLHVLIAAAAISGSLSAPFAAVCGETFRRYGGIGVPIDSGGFLSWASGPSRSQPGIPPNRPLLNITISSWGLEKYLSRAESCSPLAFRAK